MENYIGKKVIVRTNRAGVFFGTLEEVESNNAKLLNVRKLWYWDGACAVEELAVNGTIKPKECKFTLVVDEMIVSDYIQIIPCSEKAIKSLEGVEEWKRK